MSTNLQNQRTQPKPPRAVPTPDLTTLRQYHPQRQRIILPQLHLLGPSVLNNHLHIFPRLAFKLDLLVLNFLQARTRSQRARPALCEARIGACSLVKAISSTARVRLLKVLTTAFRQSPRTKSGHIEDPGVDWRQEEKERKVAWFGGERVSSTPMCTRLEHGLLGRKKLVA